MSITGISRVIKLTTPSRITSKMPKAAKDPNAPKKPLTAYFAFLGEKRALIKQENPNSGIGEIAKIGGAMWKELSAEEKKPYEDAYKKGKVEYDEKWAEYIKENPEAAVKPARKKKATKPKKKKVETEDEESEVDEEDDE